MTGERGTAAFLGGMVALWLKDSLGLSTGAVILVALIGGTLVNLHDKRRASKTDGD